MLDIKIKQISQIFFMHQDQTFLWLLGQIKLFFGKRSIKWDYRVMSNIIYFGLR